MPESVCICLCSHDKEWLEGGRERVEEQEQKTRERGGREREKERGGERERELKERGREST